jgi:hypothetical protein
MSIVAGLKGGFGFFDNGVKAGRIRDGDLAKHLAVQSHVGFFQAADELAVSHAALTTGGIQPNNPKCSEVALSLLAPDSCIHLRTNGGFFSQTVQMSWSANMALDGLEDPFSCAASGSAFSYSWHISFP